VVRVISSFVDQNVLATIHLAQPGSETSAGAVTTPPACGWSAISSAPAFRARKTPASDPKTWPRQGESEAHVKSLIAVVLLLLSTGCSIKRVAVNKFGNALALGRQYIHQR